MEEILGEDFFKDEIRSDFLVTAKRKRIWAVLLDMYLSFAEICEKYNLKYFVLGGTMLGAVRHNGFIPWDDDLDVGMMREDYNRFLNLAINDFPDPLFLQTPYSDPEYFLSWARLRNSYSTGVSKNFAHRKFNQGLFLDIFPLDFCNPDTAISDTKAIYVCAKKCGAWMRKGSTVLTESQKSDEIAYFTDNPLLEWEKIQSIASNPKYYGSGYVCNSVNTIANIQERIRPTHCYQNVEKHQFENIEVLIPSGYDELLTIQYGDYMKFPPIEKRGDKHSDIIFDADIPYTEFHYEK